MFCLPWTQVWFWFYGDDLDDFVKIVITFLMVLDSGCINQEHINSCDKTGALVMTVMTPVKTHLPLSPMSNISPPMSNILRCPRVLWNITAMGGSGGSSDSYSSCFEKCFDSSLFHLVDIGEKYDWRLLVQMVNHTLVALCCSRVVNIDWWTTNGGSWWKSCWCWWLVMMTLGDDDDLWKVPW